MSISITVPIERKALTAAAKMFQSLADDMSEAVVSTDVSLKVADLDKFMDDIINKVSKSMGVPKEMLMGKGTPETAVSATVEECIADGDSVVAVVTPEATAMETFAAPTPEAETPAPPAPMVATGVELDADGLPWDERIHAGSKALLAKGGGWKKKRGVAPELLASVEAELRQVMAVPSPSAPATEIPAPIPVMEVPAETPVHASGIPHPAAIVTSAITTFPELIQAITAGQIAQDMVVHAVNAQGLRALPLLAARPDLIPAVAAELGL